MKQPRIYARCGNPDCRVRLEVGPAKVNVGWFQGLVVTPGSDPRASEVFYLRLCPACLQKGTVK